MQQTSATDPQNASKPSWRPLNRIDRRVIGVLVEKAKTTPDAYPLSLNALTTGCNQKSNRHPQMQLNPDEVEQSLERLRAAGAVAEVSGSGRVPRYRHYMYEWLGVDKVELAVMAELLLRGPQTVGELRSHVARMEPIADLGELMPIVDRLIQKGLMVALTPAGRGQVVSHALFPEEEMTRVRGQYAGVGGGAPLDDDGADVVPPPRTDGMSSPPAARAASPADDSAGRDGLAESIRQELQELRDEVQQLRQQLGELERRFEQLGL